MKNELFIVKVISLVGVAFILSFLMSYPLMILWNECLVPAVTVIHPVEWIQMWGITFLIQSLCKTSNK